VEFTTSYSHAALLELDRQNGVHSLTPQQSIQGFVHSSASLKRTVLFPIYLSSDKWAKLRVSVSSVWINHNKQQQQQPELKEREQKLNTYFVVDEETQVIVPSYLTSANSAQLTPKLLMKSRWLDSFSGSPSQSVRSSISDLSIIRSPDLFNEGDAELSKTLNEAAEKNEVGKLIDTLAKVKRQVTDQIDNLQQSVTNCESKLDQLFETLEVLEAEKMGLCKQEGLEQLVPLMNDHHATDVFRSIVFCDLHGCSQLYELGFNNNQDDMVVCLDLYYSVLRDCLRQCMGVELTNFDLQNKLSKRLSLDDKTREKLNQSPENEESVPIVKTPSISDTVICAFETTKQAVRFTLQVHLKLIEANWPESLLKLDGMLEMHQNSTAKHHQSLARQFLYRGLRCRMSVDSRTKDKSLLTTVKRATFLCRYAHGGQTLVTNDAWQVLQYEKEALQTADEQKTRTLVQDLGTVEVDGFDKSERIRLLIPEKCKGREFQEFELNVFPVQQCSLMNVLDSNLERLQESVASQIRAKLQYLEETRYQLQGLARILETSVQNNQTNVIPTALKEFSERQSKLAVDIQAIKHEGVVNVQHKVKSIEKDLLKLSSQFLTVQMKKRSTQSMTSGTRISPRNRPSSTLNDVTSGSHNEPAENTDVDIQVLLEKMRHQNDAIQTKIRSITSLNSE
jgi:hypothetical protein